MIRTRLVATASIVSAALGGGVLAVAPARAAEQQVGAAANQFAPNTIVAGSGDTLRFDNTDITSHNVTSASPGYSFGTSGNVAPGANAVVTGVDKLPPGTYSFVCTLHPGMSATLQVLPASGAGPGPPPPGGPPALPGPGDLPNPVDLEPKVAPAPLTGSEWPLYGHDLGNSRAGGADAPSWNEAPTLGPVWSFKSTTGDFTGTPVEAAGTVVVGSFGGSVYALDASTGQLRWRHDFNTEINGSAAIDSGRVFVPLATTSAPSVAALNLSDGTPLWQTQVDSQHGADVYGSPVVSNGTVYIGTSALNGETSDPNVTVRGSVVALDATTGALSWKTYIVPPGFDGGAVWSTPAIDPAAGLIYVGTGNAYHPPAASTTDSIVVLNTAGAIVNHYQATAGDVWTETGNATSGPDADFGASPQFITGAAGRQLVGEGQKSGTYWAVDRATLQPAWNTLTQPQASFVGAIVGSTAYDGTRIYGTDTPTGEIWALNPDGSYAWLSSDVGPLQYGPPAVANGVVYTANMSGVLTARDTTTGAVLAKLPLGAPSWGGVSIAGGYVYAVTGNQGASGYVVGYRPRG